MASARVGAGAQTVAGRCGSPVYAPRPGAKNQRSAPTGNRREDGAWDMNCGSSLSLSESGRPALLMPASLAPPTFLMRHPELNAIKLLCDHAIRYCLIMSLTKSLFLHCVQPKQDFKETKSGQIK